MSYNICSHRKVSFTLRCHHSLKIIFNIDYQKFGRLSRIFGIKSNFSVSISETFSIFNSLCVLIKYSRFKKKFWVDPVATQLGRDPKNKFWSRPIRFAAHKQELGITTFPNGPSSLYRRCSMNFPILRLFRGFTV